MFADDTKILKAMRNKYDEIQLQNDLDALNAWCETWKMNLNIDKSSVMRLSLSGKSVLPHNYTIDGVEIPVSTKQKDLGVLVKCNLSWSDQYSQMCKKAYI